jgi:hypothetical protein
MVSLRARGRRLSALAATNEDSKGAAAIRGLIGLLVVAGAALLVWAETSTLYQIKVGQVVVRVGQTGDHHSYALVPIAALALLMGFGGVVGRSRPALAAVIVLGLAALLIALLVDRPDTNAEGLYGVRYESAHATAREGLTRELGGGGMLVLAGVIGVVALPRRRPVGEPAAEAAEAA